MLGCSGLASCNEQVLLSVVGCQAPALLVQTGPKLKKWLSDPLILHVQVSVNKSRLGEVGHQ
jgi:hypothetical protein